MKIKIPDSVTRTVSKQVMKSRKNAPTLLFVAGVAGVVTSTVLACRATLRLHDELTPNRQEMNALENTEVRLTDKEFNRAKLNIYVDTAFTVTKLYGPSIVLGAVSVGMLTKSHDLLSKRNAGLTAAYAALDQGFKDYRKRVQDELGDDKDREFLHGSETSTVTTEGTNGPKKEKKKHFGPGSRSPYAALFGPHNVNWDSRPEYNVFFLRSQERWANERLQRKGYLFLNDVRDALGLEPTKGGQVTGWIFDPKNNHHGGDGYISFGIFDDENIEAFHAFVSGLEGEVVIDFNVDGEILDKF